MGPELVPGPHELTRQRNEHSEHPKQLMPDLMGPHLALSSPPPQRGRGPDPSGPAGTTSERKCSPLSLPLTSLPACLPSFGNHAGGLKRKGAAAKEEPQRKRKARKAEAPSEDLLVAMALSRSEMEQEAVPAALRLGSAVPGRTLPGAGRRGPGRGGLPPAAGGPLVGLSELVAPLLTALLLFSPEKKSRKKKAPISPPQLLVQDAETTRRQMEARVAQLLAEEAELPSTPPLPPSRILKEELEKARQRLPPPEGKQNFLWEGSALTGAWAPESFYTASLVPPVVPQPPPKVRPPLWAHTGELWAAAGSSGVAAGCQQPGREAAQGGEGGQPGRVGRSVSLCDN